jgi:hypothetical protein
MATTANLNYPPVAKPERETAKPEVTEASRNHLDARTPAPGKANGKKKRGFGAERRLPVG